MKPRLVNDGSRVSSRSALHDGGQYLAAAQFGGAQVAFGALPDGRQHLAQVEHVAKFRLVARIAITRMVAVLLAAAGIARGGLDMAFRIRADPHVGPRRRNDQRIDAAALLGIADASAAGFEENPTLAGPAPRDAGHTVGHIIKTGTAGRLAMLYGT